MKNRFDNLKIKFKLLLSFSLFFVLAIAIIGVSYVNSNRLASDSEWVSHTHEVIAKVKALLASTIDAETGQRGYLITGLERYLEPFNSAGNRNSEYLDEIRILTNDNQNQQKRLIVLEDLIEQKMAELGTTIVLKRKGNDDEALRIVLTDNGKNLQDQIRVLIEDMIQEENNLLAIRMESSQQGQEITHISLLLFLGLSLAIGIVTSVYISNSISKPISMLSDSVLQLADGNYQATIPVNNDRNDERSTISKSFNLMTATLNDTFNSIIEKSTELEKKNKELDDFSYIISHDLKAPLRAISSLTCFLKEDVEDKLDGDDLEKMNLIISRTKRMDQLINDVLSYSKLGRESIVKTEEDTTLILEEVAGEVQTEGSAFNIKFEGNFPTMYVERIFLRQIFGNLISNAIKYNDKENGELIISYRNEDSFHNFSFKDNGPGIPSEFHEKIFEIFQTVHGQKRTDSTGIGLATVRKIIDSMGGEIILHAEEDQGCNFEVKLAKKS